MTDILMPAAGLAAGVLFWRNRYWAKIGDIFGSRPLSDGFSRLPGDTAGILPNASRFSG